MAVFHSDCFKIEHLMKEKVRLNAEDAQVLEKCILWYFYDR